MRLKQIQVEKEHYDFLKYVDKKRWMSYYYQIKESIESGCKSFPILGKGDGIVPLIVEKMVGGLILLILMKN